MENKQHYDISMSKRTRKPLNLSGDYENGEEEGYNGEGKSLKQLILNGKSEEINRGRNSLEQHFTEEEKELQVVRINKKQGVEIIKLKGMMGHCFKVLKHLIKLKHDSTRINIRTRDNRVYDTHANC
ncbi:hypothetical protein M5689_001350 [Euphorbia peplus]|nr:hypothetical protein M5689_001350 [Euphorbia peplus]